MPFPILFLKRPTFGRLAVFAVALGLLAALAGCVGEDDSSQFPDRAYQPLPPQMLALMKAKGMTDSAPILFRTYKKEAEFEVWKMRADGRYALLKTYPMCRWSGQLGPKKREGDRQVPEGFYAIYPAQMNPHSHYYLSFDVGYPNAYDRAHGYTGESIMVHGICSSAGCFSMTDPEIAEIYALARDAFAAGQPEIQLQSMPFHMTAANFAKYRLDPNIDFWRELKNGTDNFEVTKQEVAVGVCDRHYVFNAAPANGGSFDPAGPCPLLRRDPVIHDEVLAKEARDNAQVASLVAAGTPAIHTVYVDGGQNVHFRSMKIADVSRPDALAESPVDVTLKRHGRVPTLAQLRAARAKDLAAAAAAEKKARELRLARGETGSAEPSPVIAPAETAPAATTPIAAPTAPAAQSSGSSGSFFSRFFPHHQAPPAAAPASQTAAATPVPSGQNSSTGASAPQAAAPAPAAIAPPTATPAAQQ